MEGWVNLSTAVKVHSPCSRLYIAAAVAINTTVSSDQVGNSRCIDIDWYKYLIIGYCWWVSTNSKCINLQHNSVQRWLPAVLQFLALSERDGSASLGTWGPWTGSASGHWGVVPTAQSLEETLWTASYQLAEGDWYWCTVSQHRDPLSLK